MPDESRRRALGPSITYKTVEGRMGLSRTIQEGPMPEIAVKDGFVEDEFGVRRLVKAGSQIPPGWGVARGEVESETVSRAELTAPVVDEEASKSRADLTGDRSTSRDPNEGIDTSSARQLAKDAGEPARKAREKD